MAFKGALCSKEVRSNWLRIEGLISKERSKKQILYALVKGWLKEGGGAVIKGYK